MQLTMTTHFLVTGEFFYRPSWPDRDYICPNACSQSGGVSSRALVSSFESVLIPHKNQAKYSH